MFLAAAAGSAAAITAIGQTPSQAISPNATPRDWSGQVPVQYPDPDIVALDPRFNRYMVRNTPIKRLTPAAVGRGPGVERRRPLSRVERHPEQRADALARRRRPRHAFPQSVRLQQRQHLRLSRPAVVVRARRPARGALRARWHDHGARRRLNGKRLNSPNDVVVHPDGGIWFTDPPYGIGGNYEGFKRRIGAARRRCTAWTRRRGRSTRSTTKSAGRTACVSRPITRSCTWPTPAAA